ncbi:MAG TPA: alpha/beta fold hydrolase [Thermomicrobiales bacterium]|nr:alpha/beta fold hydrolase [Thermomicrobiales bacterium]
MAFAVIPGDGVRIHYEVEGDGPPLLLLSGLTVTIDAWRDLGYVDALRDAFTLVMPDSRGHGLSDKPREPDAYTLARMASDAIAVLDSLAIERAHLFGYSMGAHVAYVAAHAHPSRFTSLITGGGPLRSPCAIFEQLRPVLELGPATLVKAFDQPPGSLPGSRRAQLLETDTEALLALITERGKSWSLEALLPEIPIPALVYAGENDGLHSDARRAAELLPNATFLSLPGLNHLQAMARASVVLPHIQRFLGEAAPRS